MHILVGLGNPGAEYVFTRHNFGFMVIDALQRAYNFEPFKKKFGGEISKGIIEGNEYLLLKPLTFMNLSGKSVAEALNFYKLTVNNITVFHDDLGLAPFDCRVKKGGGAGGHNGLRSIDQLCGNEYKRIRLGIGHPGHDVSNYVLTSFNVEEKQILPDFLEKMVDQIPKVLHPTNSQ